MKTPEFLLTVPLNTFEMRDLLGSMEPTERVELFAWAHRQMLALDEMARLVSGVM